MRIRKRSGFEVAVAGLLAAMAAGVAAPACDDDDDADGGGSGGDIGGPPVPGPTPPVVGQQIDRAGRDGINHAVSDPWGLQEIFSYQIRDAYNRADDRSQWPAQFEARFRFSIGIWDGVDGVCGNQVGAGPAAVAGRYDTLTALLVDDVLLLDTTHKTCTTYFSVERAILGGGEIADCGGRVPGTDTPDITMTLLAAGPGGRNADGTYLYTDAVSSDKDGATSSTEMPFLLPAGTGSPDTTTGGGVDVEHGYLVCSGLGETRCARVYQCWGRSNIPEAYRDAYAYEVAQCVRQQGAECRGLSNTTYGPQCPGSVFDPQGLRDCERLYALATCEEIMAAGTSLLPGCTSLCVN